MISPSFYWNHSNVAKPFSSIHGAVLHRCTSAILTVQLEIHKIIFYFISKRPCTVCLLQQCTSPAICVNTTEQIFPVVYCNNDSWTWTVLESVDLVGPRPVCGVTPPVSDAEHAHGAAHQLIHCGPCLGFPDHCEVDVAVVYFSFSITAIALSYENNKCNRNSFLGD